MVAGGVEFHKLAMQIGDILVGDPGCREVAVQLANRPRSVNHRASVAATAVETLVIDDAGCGVAAWSSVIVRRYPETSRSGTVPARKPCEPGRHPDGAGM